MLFGNKFPVFFFNFGGDEFERERNKGYDNCCVIKLTKKGDKIRDHIKWRKKISKGDSNKKFTPKRRPFISHNHSENCKTQPQSFQKFHRPIVSFLVKRRTFITQY